MTWLRSIVFLVFLFTVTPVMALLCTPALFMGEQASRACIRAWAKIILGGLHVICGVSYRVMGGEHIPRTGAVIAANHQSMWETIALFAILPRPVMVFKKELTKNPVYGAWAKYAGLAIDRSAGIKALRALTEAAREQIAENRQLILFPEGTRIACGERAKLQPGVAAICHGLDVSCTPAAHNSGAHWRHPGPLKIPGEIIIRFLPPVPPGENRKSFTKALDETIVSARPDLAAASNNGAPPEPLDALTPA